MPSGTFDLPYFSSQQFHNASCIWVSQPFCNTQHKLAPDQTISGTGPVVRIWVASIFLPCVFLYSHPDNLDRIIRFSLCWNKIFFKKNPFRWQPWHIFSPFPPIRERPPVNESAHPTPPHARQQTPLHPCPTPRCIPKFLMAADRKTYMLNSPFQLCWNRATSTLLSCQLQKETKISCIPLLLTLFFLLKARARTLQLSGLVFSFGISFKALCVMWA